MRRLCWRTAPEPHRKAQAAGQTEFDLKELIATTAHSAARHLLVGRDVVGLLHGWHGKK